MTIEGPIWARWPGGELARAGPHNWPGTGLLLINLNACLQKKLLFLVGRRPTVLRQILPHKTQYLNYALMRNTGEQGFLLHIKQVWMYNCHEQVADLQSFKHSWLLACVSILQDCTHAWLNRKCNRLRRHVASPQSLYLHLLPSDVLPRLSFPRERW